MTPSTRGKRCTRGNRGVGVVTGRPNNTGQPPRDTGGEEEEAA